MVINIKYVKLTALLNTWLEEGSEAWEPNRNNRFTLDEWNEVSKSKKVLVLGLRIELDGKVHEVFHLRPKEEFRAEVVDAPAEQDWENNCIKPSVILEVWEFGK